MESLSSLFKEFSFRPRHSAGQNFLIDPKILEAIDGIVQCPEGDLLLEVGGGYGALTEKLATKGRSLVVVEPDHKLFAMLERRFASRGPSGAALPAPAHPKLGPRHVPIPQNGNKEIGTIPASLNSSIEGRHEGPGSGDRADIRFIKADILKLDLQPYRPDSPGLITLAGNIPYYLTSPLITRLLSQYHGLFRAIYLMVQKEVADRLVARPGTKAYGALTLCAQYYARVEKRLDVPARCFKPAPKVESAFIEIVPKETLPLGPEDEKRFFGVVRAIFQTRRKMLSNSLKSLGKAPETVNETLKKCHIDPNVRGETLGIEKLMELSKALAS